MNDRKVTSIPTPELDKLRALMDSFARNWDQRREILEWIAKEDFAKLKAYQSAGFSEAQAFELVKTEKIKAPI